jgi:hypothetical protein
MPHRTLLLVDSEIAAKSVARTSASPSRTGCLTPDGTTQRNETSSATAKPHDPVPRTGSLGEWRQYTCLIIDSDQEVGTASPTDPTVWHGSFDEAVAAALASFKPNHPVAARTSSPSRLRADRSASSAPDRRPCAQRCNESHACGSCSGVPCTSSSRGVRRGLCP